MENNSYRVLTLHVNAYAVVRKALLEADLSHQVFKDGTLDMAGLAFRSDGQSYPLHPSDPSSFIKATILDLGYPKDKMLQDYLRRITPLPERFVAGVANVFEDVTYRLFPPNRHRDVIRSALMHINRLPFSGYEQGFFDNQGVFLTRQDAWAVALSAGQIINPNSPTAGTLYSEDLYANHIGNV